MLDDSEFRGKEVQSNYSGIADNIDLPTNSFANKSRWLQLLVFCLVAEVHNMVNTKKGAERACIHNLDSIDFMNEDKFEKFLKKTKATEPFHWDLLDEMGMKIVEHIVEDEDQSPTKEWGSYGWYRHPNLKDINKVSSGNTVYLLPILTV
jgi:hypothetical protein